MEGLSSVVPTQGSPAVTRVVHASDDGFHSTMVSKEEGSSPSTYEIVMVSLSGSLLLLVAISVAISVLRRRCTSKYSSKNLSTPVVVENIAVVNHSPEKVSTVDLNGPVCVSYISDKQSVSPESGISEETISIFEPPFYSFAISMAPPDPAAEQ